MKKLLFLLLFLPLLTNGGELEANKYPKAPTLKLGELPIGTLGYPIGHYLTIEGKSVIGTKSGWRTGESKKLYGNPSTCSVKVTKINGKILKKPIYVWIDNIRLPVNKGCAIKGYETFRTIGQPPAVERAAEEKGIDITEPQAGWQVQFYFIALSVVSPKGLKIIKKGKP